jgi:pimeloyl-ACP methyl ester carboxylesterase
VTTEDGYILKLYRISGGKNQPKMMEQDPSKKVVLLQHGIFDSSDSWIANVEKQALPFILANMGYDVWLGNNRGNKYSRNHKSLNPDKEKSFWYFSYHEMGLYDLPAIIDFILLTTGREKISYIGHSQGTAQLFAALTLKTDYFKKRLNAFLAFGPVSSLGNLGSTFLKTIAKTKLDEILTSLNIFNEFLPNTQSVETLQKYICTSIGAFCKGLLGIISDANPKDDDMQRFLIFLSKFPSGSSLKAVHHFADSVRNKRFAQLDKNSTPYDLSLIKGLPISLFVGKDDLLATVDDNRGLKTSLEANGVLHFYKEYENTGHLSFFISQTNEHVSDAISVLEKLNHQ